MKRSVRTIIASLTIIGTAVVFASPHISHATSFYVENQPTQHSTTSYIAPYKGFGTPAHSFKIYAWVGDVADTALTTWKRNIVVTQVSPTYIPANFAVEFNYAQLGLVAGKTYAYILADQTTSTGTEYFATPGTNNRRCFTVMDGEVACPGAGGQTIPGQTGVVSTSLTLETTNQTLVSQNVYDQQFNITPDAPLNAATSVVLRVYTATDQNNPFKTATVNLPSGNLTTSPTIENLPTGSYTAVIYAGTQKVSQVVPFVVPVPQQNQPSQNQNTPVITGQTQNNVIGGVVVSFPQNLQTIGNNSATIVGVVTVNLPLAVDLSAVSGAAGTPLGNAQQVLNVPQMTPGTSQSFTINFTGLAPGTSYQFAIKNNITNNLSSVLQFTTTGGTAPGGVITYTGGLFPYTPSAVIDGQSTPIPGVVDTISGKGLVPKCGRSQNEDGTVPTGELRMCGYQDFLQLITNVITFGLIILGPIAAIAILYAGFMIIVLSWNGDPTAEIMAKRKQYMTFILRMVVGIVIILSAWVIVATILRELGVKPAYILLDIFS